MRKSRKDPIPSHDDVTDAIPQHLIDMALRRTNKAVADLVAFDEGPALDYPLHIKEEVRGFGFGRFLIMSTLLASLIAFTGLQVAQSHAPATGAQGPVSSGIQTMSAAELIQLIRTENRTVYWLDSRQGDSYTKMSPSTGRDQVFYRVAGAPVSNLNQFEVNVDTYRDYSTYDLQPHPLLGANELTTSLPGGGTITYSSESPSQAFVQFADKPEVVVLNYPAVQSVPTMINDAENLVPIR